MLRSTIVPAAVAVILLFVPSSPHAASFDCARARTEDEHAVCGNPIASMLDALLPAAFATAKARFADEATQIDRDFLDDRRACGHDAACLVAVSVGVLGRFHDLGAPPTVPPAINALTISGPQPAASMGVPTRLGACAATTIAAVAPRLQGDGPLHVGDYDNGTSIRFTNGSTQVSYDKEPAAIASRPGDPVMMCVAWEPHHCPPGDNRGRFSMVTNIRTGGTWTLPDSQHLCGGA